MLSLTGHNYIGGERRAAGTVEHKSLDASSGEALPYTFIQATPEEVDAAAQAAAAAYPTYRNLSAVRRAEFLEAIADEIGQKLKDEGEFPQSVEGYNQAEWILADYGNFLIHVFSEKARAYYDLERLWRNAKDIAIPPE